MANLIFPQSPFLDPTGRPAREWVQWLQNPDVQSFTTTVFVAETVTIDGGTIANTDLNTQANTNNVLNWIGTTSQPTVNVYPIPTMTTLAILDGYYFNDLENATPLYQGKSDINANWLVIEYDQTTGTINYANIGNNPLYTDYNSAWAARATLVYDEFQNMVFP